MVFVGVFGASNQTLAAVTRSWPLRAGAEPDLSGACPRLRREGAAAGVDGMGVEGGGRRSPLAGMVRLPFHSNHCQRPPCRRRRRGRRRRVARDGVLAITLGMVVCPHGVRLDGPSGSRARGDSAGERLRCRNPTSLFPPSPLSDASIVASAASHRPHPFLTTRFVLTRYPRCPPSSKPGSRRKTTFRCLGGSPGCRGCRTDPIAAEEPDDTDREIRRRLPPDARPAIARLVGRVRCWEVRGRW